MVTGRQRICPHCRQPRWIGPQYAPYCTRTCKRDGGPVNVTCDICAKVWDSRDPGVRWLNIDGVWSCADETQCFARQSMQRALDTLAAEPTFRTLPLEVVPDER